MFGFCLLGLLCKICCMEAIMHTSEGDIRIELFPFVAPVTVKNFVELAKGEREWVDPNTGKTMVDTPLYDGVIFHRIIDGFMIQGGDPTGTGMGGPGYTFDDEIDFEYNFDEPYVLAMANAGRRDGHGTNGSQFFITVVPTQWLHGKHTVFGKVADDRSKAVVDKIATVATDMRDRPLDDVVISSIEIIEN